MKNLIIVAIITLFLTGCKNDFLELTPLDKISETSVWSDESLVQAYINAQYSVISTGFDEGLYSGTDEIIDSRRQESLRNIDETELVGGPYDQWNSCYSSIKNINVFFSKIDKSAEYFDFDPDNTAKMIAEMKFLRAYAYMRLYIVYGGVPIIEKVYTSPSDSSMYDVTRNTARQTFDYIMSDLNDVIASDLPDKQPASSSGRACRDAARAIKARLLLYDASSWSYDGTTLTQTEDMDKWQAASDANWELIASGRYELYPDYKELFRKDASEGNTEIIFEKSYSLTSSHNWTGLTMPPMCGGGFGHLQPSASIADAFEMINGELYWDKNDTSTIEPTINPLATDLFNPDNPHENRDPRYYVVFGYNGKPFNTGTVITWRSYTWLDMTMTGYYFTKFTLEPMKSVSWQDPYDNPWIISRLAEIYLNYAECQYHLGHEDVAREYVNKVRARTSVEMPPITDEGEELLDRILHERKVELCFEGFRYFDLRRNWDYAKKEMSRPLITYYCDSNDNGETVYYERTMVVGAGTGWGERNNLSPIPSSERALNPKLTQNPGYDDGYDTEE